MQKPTRVITKDSPEDLALVGADLLRYAAAEKASHRGNPAVAISGGSTPRPMHRILAEEPWVSAIPWHRIHIFWVDERCVPISDPVSNYGTARRDFLDRVPLPESHIHPMPIDHRPREGAKIYQETLVKFFQPFGNQPPVFDLIFLGLGKDGHTASLFPGHKALEEKERLVVAVKGGKPEVNRITMTLPVLNQASHVVFVVTGRHKAEIVTK